MCVCGSVKQYADPSIGSLFINNPLAQNDPGLLGKFPLKLNTKISEIVKNIGSFCILNIFRSLQVGASEDFDC
ncbi:hypothetical protein JTE90_025348 [Oedothorax gibbosus]|uniref:Uncharacterized protein n=1 Tax=Oedothorax gibbosus TaxID=931172 RepID=A0AAV6TWH8_9ARAC|nr:hypothetical protein JTE90_025348 [Oedothorax gibbosus]